MIDYILRTLVYIQSFFWLRVIGDNRQLLIPESLDVNYYSMYSGFMIAAMIYVFDAGFSQYPSHLLGFYVLAVILCFNVFSTKYYIKDAASLAFLIVFINSYYWESMLHLNAIMFNGINFNQIVQAFHLFPAYFLVKRIEFYNDKVVMKKLLYGLVISGVNVTSYYFTHVLTNIGYRFLINPLTRILCLAILIDIVMFDIKKIKRIWF